MNKLLLPCILTLAAACGCDEAVPAGEACCTAAPASTEPLPADSVLQLDSAWTDQTGRTRRLDEFRGQVTVVAMVFTHCAWVCPRLAADARGLIAALPAAQRRSVRGLLVSFDTARDTPERLRAWAAEQGLDQTTWTLLRGEADAVRELAAVLGVSYQQGANGDFAHSNLITILDSEGRIAHRLAGLQVDAAPALAAIERLLH